MGWYYNRSRGPVPIPLQTGKSLCALPKSWLWIEPEDEGSPALIAALKVDLVRGRDGHPAPEPKKTAEPVKAQEPASPAAAPSGSAGPEPEQAAPAEDVPVQPSMQESSGTTSSTGPVEGVTGSGASKRSRPRA